MLPLPARMRLEAGLGLTARLIDWLFDSICLFERQPLEDKYTPTPTTSDGLSPPASLAADRDPGTSASASAAAGPALPDDMLTLAPSGSTQQL